MQMSRRRLSQGDNDGQSTKGVFATQKFSDAGVMFIFHKSKVLIRCQNTVTEVYGTFPTALQAALYGGYAAIAQLLLDGGADVNAQD